MGDEHNEDVTRRPFLLDAARGGLEARLQAALAAGSDAFFEVDLGAGTIRWSRGVTLLFGHDPDRVGRRVADWQSFIHPEDASRVIESGRSVLPSGGTTWSDEFRFARSEGSYASVRARAFVIKGADGRPSHVVGALTDLSDVRERERELHALSEDLVDSATREQVERARNELLMRAARFEVFGEWDISSGRCSWSPNVESVLGHPAVELTDLDAALRWAHPDDGMRALEDLRRAIAAGADSWAGRLRFRRGDGTEVTLDARGFVVRDASGQAVKVIGSLSPAGALDGAAAAPVLTERQRRVLELVRAGHTNKAIAAELGISEQAAKVQVRRLMRKFGAANRAALAALSQLS